jgi:hypothetical protein
MDNFKGLAKRLGGNIHSQQLSYWNIGMSYRHMIVKDYAEYKVEINDFDSVYEITIKADSNFACSINIPDKLFGWIKPTKVSQFRYKAYFSADKNPFASAEVQDFWKVLGGKINALNFSDSEGVFFHSYPQLVLKPERDIISILDDIINVVANNEILFRTRSKEKIYTKNIPQNLRSLVPLLKKWSIADDGEREQLLEETSERQKKILVNKVKPYMTEINSFLDSFGDEAQSHEAMLLGNLAELISEIWVD